jgi:hypothetical protein
MGSGITLPFGLYFVALFLALFFGRKPLNNRWLFLFRSLFPSWQFYHAPGPTPRIFWHRTDEAGASERWQPLIGKTRWCLASLWYNPAVNLAHAQQTLIEQLANDLASREDSDHIEDWVSYRMVKRLVREIVDKALPPEATYTFCLCLPFTAEPVDIERDKILQSPVMRREEA